MGLEDKLSRREFLGKTAETAVKGGAVLLTVGGTGSAITKIGLIVPERKTAKVAGFDLYPGWIEANTEARLIDPTHKGHLPFLREAVINNPVLNNLTKEYYAYLGNNLMRQQRLCLGDALNFAITGAYEKLKETNPAKISPQTNPLLESMHAGLFVFAAGFMPWLNTADLTKIGVDLKGYRDSEKFFSALGASVYPKLFTKEYAKDDPTNLASGQDRSVHLAQHLLLTFEYLYSRCFGLGLERSIPLGLQVYMYLASLGIYPSFASRLRREAKIFSESLGIGWELFGLLHADNWPILNQDPGGIKEGPFDEMIEADYKANELGALTGIEIFFMGIAGEQIENVTLLIEKLDNKKFLNLDTKPEL